MIFSVVLTELDYQEISNLIIIFIFYMLWIRLRASKALIPSLFINHWSNRHPLSAMESLVCRYCQKMDKELIKNPSGAEVQYFDGRNGQLTEENKKNTRANRNWEKYPTNKQTYQVSNHRHPGVDGAASFITSMTTEALSSNLHFVASKKNRPTLRQVLHTHNRTWIQPSTNPKYRFPLFLGSTEHIYGIRSFW